jgi:prevent-host-death family protein
MRRIGIRELRQNASQYIRLVKAGETIEVTERGVPVAVLAPPPAEPERKKTRREELIEQGLLIPGTQDWSSWKPLPAKPGERTLSAILQEMRDEDDR